MRVQARPPQDQRLTLWPRVSRQGLFLDVLRRSVGLRDTGSYDSSSFVLGTPKLEWLMNGKEGNVLFNNALKTFYLWLYGVRHTVKDHSDSERGNLLPPHGLLFPISNKGSFICTIPQTG